MPLGRAFSASLQHAVHAGITAIGFHQLGTHCTSRLPWPQVLHTIKQLAAAARAPLPPVGAPLDDLEAGCLETQASRPVTPYQRAEALTVVKIACRLCRLAALGTLNVI